MSGQAFFLETMTHTECLSVFVASLTNVNLEYVLKYWEYLSLCIDRMDVILRNIIFRRTQMTINNTMMKKRQKCLLTVFTKSSMMIL